MIFSNTDKPVGQSSQTLDESAQLRDRDMFLESQDQVPLAEVEAAWDKEAERRLAAYDRGEVQAVDGELVLARARAHANLNATQYGK